MYDWRDTLLQIVSLEMRNTEVRWNGIPTKDTARTFAGIQPPVMKIPAG